MDNQAAIATASILSRAGLTLAGAAALCGVTPRTIMNWRDGKSRVPADALRILECAAADAEMEAAEPMTLAERIAALRSIQQMQQAAMRRMKDEIETARRELAATTSILNALYAERGRLEKP